MLLVCCWVAVGLLSRTSTMEPQNKPGPYTGPHTGPYTTRLKSESNQEYSLLKLLGFETLYREYKEFCLKTTTSPTIPYHEIKHIIESGTITPSLQDIINESIHTTITQVFPKYFTSYANSQINGSIYIGVNDDGVITGIPSGSLTVQYVEKCLRDACAYILASMASIMSSTTVQVIPLAINSAMESSPIYQNGINVANTVTKYEKDKAELDCLIRQYKISHQEWMNKKSRYNCKLFKLLNETPTRRELIDFIKANLNRGEVPTNEIMDVCNVIKTLKQNQKIHIPTGKQLEPYKDSSNPRRENVYFWLLKFQQYHLSSLQKLKPQKPPIKRLHHPWVSLLCLRNMIPSFTRSKVGYYMIKINVCHRDSQKDAHNSSLSLSRWRKEPILFHELKKRKNNMVLKRYICKKRVLSDSNGEPSCVDIEMAH